MIVPSLDAIRELLLENLSGPELVRSIRELQEIFNSKRELLDRYPNDRTLVSAYTALYFPTNYRKLSFLAEELSEDIVEEMKQYTFIDMGTGPGTYLFAHRHSKLFSPHQQVYGIDRSEVMIKQAQKLLDGLEPDHQIKLSSAIPLQERGKCTLLWGNGLNEAGIEYCLNVIEQLRPVYLLLIEPGTKASFRQVMQLRKELFVRKYQSLYPCPDGQGICPMQNEDLNWCHQVMKTTHDPSIERLCQLSRMDRRTMPMVAHLYRLGSNRKNLNSNEARLIRILQETKHSIGCEVCSGDDEQGSSHIVRYQISKKSMTKEQVKSLKKMSWGKTLHLEVEKKLDSGYFRGRWLPQK